MSISHTFIIQSNLNKKIIWLILILSRYGFITFDTEQEATKILSIKESFVLNGTKLNISNAYKRLTNRSQSNSNSNNNNTSNNNNNKNYLSCDDNSKFILFLYEFIFHNIYFIY